MILNAYSIFDVKALLYSPPFYALNDALAQRIVADSLDGNSALARHPSDFVIYRVGTFNDATGLFDAEPIKVHVRDVVALVQPAPAPLFELDKMGVK